MGTRARRAARLSRGLSARRFALSRPPGRRCRRNARRRADARRLFHDERSRALSWLAGCDPDRGLRPGHRASALARGRCRARQSGRGLFRRHFLSALSVALAAVRLRPYLARRHSDARGDVRAGRDRRRSRDPHLSAGRGAGRDARFAAAPSRVALVLLAGSGRDRHRRAHHLRREGIPGPLSAARRAHFRLRRQWRSGEAPDAMLLSARQPRLSARGGARARGALLRGSRCGEPDDPRQADDPCRRRFARGASVRRPHRSFRGQGQCPDAVVACSARPWWSMSRWTPGVAGTPRCRAINDYVFDRIRAIRPDVLLVAGYFAQYDHEANWRYPGYLDALVAGARRLHQDGVRSIVIAGEVPTWAPVSANSRRARRARARRSRDVLARSAFGRIRSKPTGRSPPKIGAMASFTSRRRKSSAATTVAGAWWVTTFPKTCSPSTTATTASTARSSR